MRLILKLLGGLVALLLLATIGASFWFWFTPVGLNNYVNKITLQSALDSPQLLSSIGAIDNTPLDFHSGKLDDYTLEGERRMLAKLRSARAGLDRYGPEGLEGQALLSWQFAAWFFDSIIRQSEYLHGGYRLNQISGVTVSTPQFLADTHVIKNTRSVERYLSRLQEFGRVLRETQARVQDDREHGVIPPDFVIAQTLLGMRSFVEGGAASNPLVTTLATRMESAGIPAARQQDYLQRAEKLVSDEVFPGYAALIAQFEALLEQTDSHAGIWRIPQGEAVYAAALAFNTSTTLTAEEIHAVGLAEVARIEAEMAQILDAQQIEGATLAERITILMQDPVQQFDNTDAGRAQMLDYLRSVNARIMAAAPAFFSTIPPQPLEIVRVPEYAEDSAPMAYYQPSAVDGSRAGRFYVNQKDTADAPRWTLPTLMVHEGAPGHHFQLAVAQRIEGVPLIRKVVPLSGYSEGWALYAERLAKTDMGLYDDDPLGDLGRLQAEMFRAVRLVVDTGMHARRWTREESITYMLEKTGMTEAEVTREIERYAVWPGQATSYKVGQIAMLRLREEAEQTLGERFDLRAFHDVVLGSGALPLELLEGLVRDWIRAQALR